MPYSTDSPRAAAGGSALAPEKNPTSAGAELSAAELGSTTQPTTRSRELDGPTGPEPTRFGDWEKQGRCIDF
jgi:hypothetical protein